jgi:hypothetical protein
VKQADGRLRPGLGSGRGFLGLGRVSENLIMYYIQEYNHAAALVAASAAALSAMLFRWDERSGTSELSSPSLLDGLILRFRGRDPDMCGKIHYKHNQTSFL